MCGHNGTILREFFYINQIKRVSFDLYRFYRDVGDRPNRRATLSAAARLI